MTRNGLLLLVAGYLAVYILPLGIRPMAIPDETRYAQMGHEILTSGDWVVPHLNGLRYFEKPILGHWAHALSIRFLGTNAFAARLPSALAAGLTATLLLLLVHYFGGGKRIALLSAGVFLTFIEVYVVGTLCVLDGLLSLFITGAMVAFFFAYHESRPARQRIYMALMGLSCGLAFLTKGLLAFVIPLVAIVPFMLWQRHTGNLLRHLWILIATVFITAGPWLILIQRREPDFLRYFFWVEHIERFLHPNGAQHQESFWYFLPVLLGGSFPWTLMWFPAGLGLRWITDPTGLLRFSACWLVFPLLFFSASSGKLVTYILPCFVPLAIVLVAGLRAYCASGESLHFNGALRIGMILSVLILVLLLVLPCFIQVPALYGSGEGRKALLAGFGLLIFCMGWWQAQRMPSFETRMTLCILAPVLLLVCSGFLVPEWLKYCKIPGDFLHKNSAYLQSQVIIFSDEALTPAICWFAGRSDILLLGRKGELDYGLHYNDAQNRFLPTEKFETFRRQHPERPIVFVTRLRDYQKNYADILPKPDYKNTAYGFLLIAYASQR